MTPADVVIAVVAGGFGAVCAGAGHLVAELLERRDRRRTRASAART